MLVLAVDPGYEQSAWVLWDGSGVPEHGIEPNDDLRRRFQSWGWRCGQAIAVVFEQVESYGMAVGREVFETVFWTGRLFQAASYRTTPTRMPRRTVKLHLCQSARAQDSNIRTALCDRFGGKVAAVGTKKHPGPLYGIKSHEWAALALAVTYHDQHGGRDNGEEATEEDRRQDDRPQSGPRTAAPVHHAAHATERADLPGDRRHQGSDPAAARQNVRRRDVRV